MIIPVLLDDPFPRSYLKKVLQVEPANLIGLWLQNEASGDVSYDRSGNDHHGAYTGVTLGEAGVPGMGYTCPLYDGSLDYNNLNSAGLIAAFNGAAGSVIAPVKVYNAAVWEDDAVRYVIHLGADGDNRFRIYKYSDDDFLYWEYKAGGTSEFISKTSVSDISWMYLGLTWDKTADEVKAYFNGEQNGGTATSLGTWVGNLHAEAQLIGSFNPTPTQPWHGWIGPVALWTKALTAEQMAYLSKV